MASSTMKDDKTATTTESPRISQNSNDGLYRHSFWSTPMRQSRRLLLQTLFLPLLYTSLLMWACLCLFWGSLYTNNELGKLDVTLVNLDGSGGFLGETIEAGIKAALDAGPNQLRWHFISEAVAEIAPQLVLEENTWAALESIYPIPNARRSRSDSFKY